MPEFVGPFATAVTVNRLRPFSIRPPPNRTYNVSEYPALQWPSVDGEERLGSLHFASLHVPAIGSPTPLCQVSGFPGLELLWGFRLPRARAEGDLRFLHNLTSEHGLGPPFIPTPGLDRPVSHRAGLP